MPLRRYILRHALRLALVFLSLFILQSSYGQGENNLAIDGTVKEGTKKLVGATVTLIQDGTVIDKVTISKSGRFGFTLDFEHEYTMEFSKSGYVTKRITVDTKNVPPEDAEFGFEFPVKVELFKMVRGLDVSLLDKPIGKVYFDPDGNYFTYDGKYTKAIQKELETLMKELEKKREEEEELKEELERDYKLAISDAENAFKEGDYLSAKEHFEAASTIKPEEKYPKDEIKKIDKKLAEEGASEERYLSELATADKAFTTEDYEKAKTHYKNALSIKPGEPYPKEKIKEAESKLEAIAQAQSAEAAIRKKYDDLMADGDRLFNSQAYGDAKIKYQEAQSVLSEETRPSERIEEIDKLIKEQKELAQANKEKRKQYDDLIKTADANFKAKNYEKAKTDYTAASALFEEEPYPKDRIATIDRLIAEAANNAAAQAAIDAEYNELIGFADKAFDAEDYETAKTNYRKASDIKSKEVYPRERLKAIEDKLKALAKQEELAAREKEVQAKYDLLIAEGNNSFEAKSYEKARDSYNDALKLKSEEQYPKDKIAEIDGILKDLAEKASTAEKEQRKREEYNSLISKADRRFDAKGYEEAKNLYSDASKLIPEEKYPTEKIVEIDQLLEQLEKDKLAALKAQELEEKYKELVEQGDKDLRARSYEAAKTSFQQALELKANDQYSIDKIAEIDRLIENEKAALAEEQAREDDYKAHIVSADGLFKDERYEEAKATYQKALSVKPKEGYPKQQIEAIDAALARLADEAEAKAREEEEKKLIEAKYNSLISEADAAFGGKDYDKASQKYKDAQALKSDESYPQEKLDEIKNILDEIAQKERKEEEERKRLEELESKYNSLISSADLAFRKGEYEESKKGFEEALTLKSEESYPKERIQKIEELIKKQEEEELERKYRDIISDADLNFNKQNFEEAKAKYNEALTIKSEEQYPKDRIAKIDELMEAIAQKKREEEEAKQAAENKEIVEEIIEESNKTVTIRKVTLAGKTDEYKKVQHSWGGKYFFKNGEPITELIWNRDTAK